MAKNTELQYVLKLNDLMSKKMDAVIGKVDTLDKKMGSVGGQGGGMMKSVLGANLLTGAITAATGAVQDFAVSSVQNYMKMEMYEARFTTLLKDRGLAINYMKNIVQDAAKTPFDVESLVQGNSMLLSAGESSVGARKAILDLGNAIAATGGGADELTRMAVNLQQIKTLGKASAMDVKQFAFAGINIYELLATSMGKNVKQIKGMDVSYKDLTKALSDARKEGGMFYQGLENANKTLTGQVSNLGDAWDQLKTKIGASQSGILKDTISWANNMLAILNNNLSAMNDITNRMSKGGMKGYSAGVGLGDIFSKTGASGKGEIAALSQILSIQQGIAGQSQADAAAQKDKLKHMMFQQIAQFQMGTISRDQLNERLALMKGSFNEIQTIQKGQSKDALIEATAGKEKPEKGGGAASLGTTTEVSSARPQSLVININDGLVKQMNIYATTIKESASKIREEVSKTLLEVANDANLAVR